jgi:hypothetical protein
MAQEDNSYYSSDMLESPRPGPFLAKVIGHLDSTFMGILEVQILRPVGAGTDSSKTFQARYMSPFYGVTSSDHLGGVSKDSKTDTYNNTQKSYGMWMVPPDVGSLVIVIFIDGAVDKAFWIGCVADEGMNFMLPGLAATQKVVEDVKPDKAGRYGRVPVAEYNKKVDNTADPDITQGLKPQHPFADVLKTQGLLFDDIRGITSSSARREVPSMVFGISTPGPVDKQDGAQKGKIGNLDYRIDAFVSRLGGTTFVMDDGDDRYLRKTTASAGPPEYASVANNETDGKVTLPHNELFRIRTRTGHQILLHNSEDLIYIGNARGTSWIELTSDGKIDIYANDSISVHTKNDLNFYATRDINMEAGRNINIKANKEMHTHVLKDHILIVDENQKIHVKKDVDKTYEQKYTHHVKKDVNKLYDQNYLQHVLQNVDKVFDGNYQHKVVGNFDFNIGGHNFQTSGGNMEIKAANTTISGGNINLNPTSPASTASKPSDASLTALSTASKKGLPQRLKLHKLSVETGKYDETQIPPTIMRRVITAEPYVYHENINPGKVKIEKTDRDIDGRYDDTDENQLSKQSNFSETMLTPPDLWQNYTTSTDTFKVDPPPATQQ